MFLGRTPRSVGICFQQPDLGLRWGSTPWVSCPENTNPTPGADFSISPSAFNYEIHSTQYSPNTPQCPPHPPPHGPVQGTPDWMRWCGQLRNGHGIVHVFSSADLASSRARCTEHPCRARHRNSGNWNQAGITLNPYRNKMLDRMAGFPFAAPSLRNPLGEIVLDNVSGK